MIQYFRNITTDKNKMDYETLKMLKQIHDQSGVTEVSNTITYRGAGVYRHTIVFEVNKTTWFRLTYDESNIAYVPMNYEFLEVHPHEVTTTQYLTKEELCSIGT